jgi:hypothetical protein
MVETTHLVGGVAPPVWSRLNSIRPLTMRFMSSAFGSASSATLYLDSITGVQGTTCSFVVYEYELKTPHFRARKLTALSEWPH